MHSLLGSKRPSAPVVVTPATTIHSSKTKRLQVQDLDGTHDTGVTEHDDAATQHDCEGSQDGECSLTATVCLKETVGDDNTLHTDGVRPTVLRDGGWGWLVLVGCFYIATFLLSISVCFGILFHDVMRSMGVSSTNRAWILNVHVFLWNLSCILTAPLCQRLGWRVVGCTGSFIVSVAFMLMSFAVSPLYIFVLFSLIVGPVGGITAITCFLVLPHYFKKRRGMATSIFLAGISFGQIVVPMLTLVLQDEYGFSGAILIYGGILLNCFVAYALFRPVKITQLRAKQNDASASDRDKSIPLLTISQQRTSRLENAKSVCQKFNMFWCEIARTTVSNMKEIRNPRLVLVTLSFSCQLIGYLNFIMYVPLDMLSAGHTMRETSMAVSLSGVGNMLTRILFSVIADQKWLNAKFVYVSGILLAGGSSFVFPALLHSLPLLFSSLVVWGVGIAACNSLYLVLLIDVVGLELYEAGVSITCLLLAFMSITAGPAIGLVRDLTKSATLGMYACAAMQLSAAVLCLLMPCARPGAVKRPAQRSL